MRAEIAYQVVGGTKFYERAEIKDAIAYLTAMVNPQDAGAFTRIVNSPRRGIGATSVGESARVREHDGNLDLGCGRRTGAGPGSRAPPRSSRSGASWGRCALCASAPTSAAPVAKLLGELLERDRLPRGPAGGADDRGAGSDREPRGARQRRRRVRRRRDRRAHARRVPPAGRARRRRRRREPTTTGW